MSAEFEYVVVDQPHAVVRRIAIHVPDKRNALSPPVVRELSEAFIGALSDSSVHAIVLTGTEGNFCAGGDLKSMDAMTEAAARRRMQGNHAFASLVRGSNKPVVTALEGVAMGGGAGLALLADIVVAGQGARIGFPFLKVGLVPDYGLMHSLGRRVGWSQARQLILRCQTVAGDKALALGMVDEAVADAEVQQVALQRAVEAARLPREAFLQVKRAFAEFPRTFSDDMQHEFEAQVAAFIGEELVEGVNAFRERREPDFVKLR
ncbi:MAG: enoyl-CoA hydratase/isomerase family protein [Rhodocyclaceae bacterium]|jgi:2-(1,2-epoxy-1,2-dihydrophenyl)acetyl-CoA isomerase|nr:enoyl-CoA hydratase/isomerase family protein [Rhodocyclaceae bacterium]